jgi:hypothetical protein
MTTPDNLFGYWKRRLRTKPPRLPEVKTIIDGRESLPSGGFSLERFPP